MVNAKQKGSSGEREAAALLQGWAAEIGFEIDPERNLEQVRGGGYDLNGVPGLGVEVKRVEQLNVKKWWEQTTRQADADGTIPFLMYRQNRKPWRFKVRSWVAFYGEENSFTLLTEFEMDANMAKQWFQSHLATQKGLKHVKRNST